MASVEISRTLRIPPGPAAEALGSLLGAIAAQEGPWRGFALHVGPGELHFPDVGYVAVPIKLTVAKGERAHEFGIAFTSSNLPAAFPGFKGTIAVGERGLGECTLSLRGEYELPMHFFGRLLDAAMLPRVAEKSLENFVEEIGVACEARVNQREAEFARYRFYARTFS